MQFIISFLLHNKPVPIRSKVIIFHTISSQSLGQSLLPWSGCE